MHKIMGRYLKLEGIHLIFIDANVIWLNGKIGKREEIN